jgi:hypothetical protein
MNDQLKLPGSPNTDRPSSKNMLLSAKNADTLNIDSELVLVSSVTLGAMYLLAEMPLKKIATMPDKCMHSATTKGTYMTNMYRGSSRCGYLQKSYRWNTKAADQPKMVPRMGDPTASPAKLKKNPPILHDRSWTFSALDLSSCAKVLNKTSATASFKALSPKTR